MRENDFAKPMPRVAANSANYTVTIRREGRLVTHHRPLASARGLARD
jgi:hypothetical protein